MSTEARLTRTDSMSPEVAERLASAVGPGRRFEGGDLLPALWHWAYFPELAPLAELGPDGHPRRDDELAQRFPRRMAGGGRVQQLRGLVVGEPAEKLSEIVEMREHHGRSGDLVVCQWRHTYLQSGATALEEMQSLVYLPARTEEQRPASPGARAGEAPQTAQGSWEVVRHVEFSSVALFRFSAATWNSHRIHYDRGYATGEEGYPGLVVHGPLLTMLLAREAERELGSSLTLEFRSKAAVFDGEGVDVYILREDDTSCLLEARKSDGTVTTALSASIASSPGGEPGP